MADEKKGALDIKSALAEVVLPETLDDIEEYLKPEFPPRHQLRKAEEQDVEDKVNGRRIVMDGFGRWREIRPQKCLPRKKFELDIDPKQLPQMKELFRINSSASSRQDDPHGTHESHPYTFPGLRSRYNEYQTNGINRLSGQSSRQGRSSQLRHRTCSSSEDNFMYDSLGMMTRANVFPGIGNFQWNTTTSRTFTKKPVTSVEDRKNFFGIQTDSFGAWSAANVLNERMKKAWEEYLASAPKATGTV
jgi:hypothetical protein